MKKVKVMPFKNMVAVPEPQELTTPLIYYGGKSRDAKWVWSHFPEHNYYVEVFGGGAAVLFNKPRSATEVYNDKGNVAVFWRVVQTWPEELYEKLYWTPYSRDEFQLCSDTWEEYAVLSQRTGKKEDYIEFARRWFVQINISFSHREDDKSFKLALQVNNANGFTNHVDLIPYVADRLRSVMVERLHFRDILRLYDRPGTLFYADPPYVPETRVSQGTYRSEMSIEEHIELLEILNQCQAKVVLSGYDSNLYNEYTKGWYTVEKTAPSAIQNRAQLEGRASRTEKLWIKGSSYGLWEYAEDQRTSANVAAIQGSGLTAEESILIPE
jgi:DNA adenine methylase